MTHFAHTLSYEACEAAWAGDHEEQLDGLRDGEPEEGSLCQCVFPGCTCVRLVPDDHGTSDCEDCRRGEHA